MTYTASKLIKIAEELETARLSNENYDGLQKTLDEHQEFIKELKDLNGKLHEEVSDLEEENKVLKSKYKTLLYSGIIILVLTIIIFVALV